MHIVDKKKLLLRIENYKKVSLITDDVTACQGICLLPEYPTRIKRLAFQYIKELEPHAEWQQDPETFRVYRE